LQANTIRFFSLGKTRYHFWRIFLEDCFSLGNLIHICKILSGGQIYFGPSVVRALPLAAGINDGGHYFAYIILFFLLFKSTEGVVVGFQIFAWAPKKNKKI
jgi:hypothetical protein